MAIRDSKLIFSTAQAIAGSASADKVGEQYLDLGAAGKDGWGNNMTERPTEGGRLYLNVVVTTALSFSGSAGEAVVELQAAASTSSSALSSADNIGAVYFNDNEAIGASRSMAITGPLARYVGINTFLSAKLSAGAIEAWLSTTPITTPVADK